MLSWVSTEATTGRVIADLPDLDVASIKQILGAHSSVTASLPLPTAPENWERAILEGGATLVLLDDAQDGSPPVPIWGGMVTQASPSGASDVVPLSLATPEAGLDRFFVGDVTYAQVGQNAILADLINRFVDSTFPIRVVYTTPGTLRDRTYTDASDKTVLSAITELAGVEGGPEWAITWEHLTGPERYLPVLTVADRIGSPVTPGLAPGATFEMPGSVIDAVLTKDYSSGKGARSVIATSSAVADVRPQSLPQIVADPDRPAFQFRWSPSSSITEIPTLTAHAQAASVALAKGARALSLTAIVSDAPRLGREWFLGDDLGYAIGGLENDPRLRWFDVFSDFFPSTFPATFNGAVVKDSVLVNTSGRETVPAFPGGLVGIARCIGWEMTLGNTPTVTPILQAQEF